MAHNIKLPQFRDELFAELEKVKARGQDQGLGRVARPGHRLARRRGQGHDRPRMPRRSRPSYNMFEQDPGREFCEVARSRRAGVLARVHDNSSILKDVVKIDTTHRRQRSPQVPRSGLENLRPEKARTGPPLRHRSWHDRPPTRLQMAAQDPALTSITGTLLNEQEIREACRVG